MSKIKPNTCPHCGDRLKRISGLWRCEKDQYNARAHVDYGYENERFGRMDNRPYDYVTGRVEPVIEE